jgi:hypothetical protein
LYLLFVRVDKKTARMTGRVMERTTRGWTVDQI